MRPRLKNISNNNTLQMNYLFLKIVIRRNKKISHHLWFSDLKKFNYKVFSLFTIVIFYKKKLIYLLDLLNRKKLHF